jgi:starch synthase
MRVTPEYDERMARRIYAGSDFFLMPSLTEPCGLSQLYSLSYGAIPIVHATGGLADTVFDVSPANLASGKATGVVFGAPSARALKRAFQRAMALYEDKETLQKVRLIGMRQDFSWERASDAYVKLYRRAIHAR